MYFFDISLNCILLKLCICTNLVLIILPRRQIKFIYLSIYLSLSHDIWALGAHVSVNRCVCAQYLTTCQFSRRKFESNNDGWKLERFNLLGGCSPTCHRERTMKRKADSANYDMPWLQHLQGWQEHRLLHEDQGTSAVLGPRNAPLQGYCLCLRSRILF